MIYMVQQWLTSTGQQIRIFFFFINQGEIQEDKMVFSFSHNPMLKNLKGNNPNAQKLP